MPKDILQSTQRFSEQTQWMLKLKEERCKSSFGKLFDHFAPRIKGMIIKSGTAPEAADDIVQDVMLSVWRKSASFDPLRADVAGWIFQIARNRKIDIIRKEQRPVPEELAQPESTDIDPSAILAIDQEAQHLKQALSTLKPEQRELLEKAYFGDLTHSEIKAQTGLPLGTIKSRIRLGLERLRHQMQDMR